MASDIVALPSRSIENAVNRSRNPPAPTMSRSAGTRTSSKNMSADGMPWKPIRVSWGPNETPGVSLSTSSAPMARDPGSSVRRT